MLGWACASPSSCYDGSSTSAGRCSFHLRRNSTFCRLYSLFVACAQSLKVSSCADMNMVAGDGVTSVMFGTQMIASEPWTRAFGVGSLREVDFSKTCGRQREGRTYCWLIC